jgi:hypothetical protein
MDRDEGSDSSTGRSAAALRAIVAWTIAAVNSRGYGKIDPNVLIDSSTLRRVGKVMCVYSTRPIVSGAVVLLELIANMLLLIIFLALSFSPPRRAVVVEKMRCHLEAHVNSVRRCASRPLAERPRRAARPPPLRAARAPRPIHHQP